MIYHLQTGTQGQVSYHSASPESRVHNSGPNESATNDSRYIFLEQQLGGGFYYFVFLIFYNYFLMLLLVMLSNAYTIFESDNHFIKVLNNLLMKEFYAKIVFINLWNMLIWLKMVGYHFLYIVNVTPLSFNVLVNMFNLNLEYLQCISFQYIKKVRIVQNRRCRQVNVYLNR